jgi:hypothetical protein
LMRAECDLPGFVDELATLVSITETDSTVAVDEIEILRG